jgi:chloramphenicol 3-O-phosphotransferase
MEQRASAYAQADMSVDTSNLTVEEVAQLILVRLQQQKELRIPQS